VAQPQAAAPSRLRKAHPQGRGLDGERAKQAKPLLASRAFAFSCLCLVLARQREHTRQAVAGGEGLAARGVAFIAFASRSWLFLSRLARWQFAPLQAR
jgi:hypothetical protein